MNKQLSAIFIALTLAFGTTFATTQTFASTDDEDKDNDHDDEEIKGPINGKVVLNKLTNEYVRIITPSNAFLTQELSDE